MKIINFNYKSLDFINCSYYTIDDKGNLYSSKSFRYLNAALNKRDGYLKVCLIDDDNKQRVFRLHRLVALAFIPNINNQGWIKHKDSNKLNNSIDNLEWCDKSVLPNAVFPKKNNYGKVNAKKVKCINNGMIFDSAQKAANWCNGDRSHVTKCCKLKLKTHKNYNFKYVINK